MMLKSLPKVGFDIDDTLCDWFGAYCSYFNTDKHPGRLAGPIITRNVERVLKKDRNFWLNLELTDYPNFEIELYCTKRVNNKDWTKKWISKVGLPNKPVYQVWLQSTNKADKIKNKVDLFIDNSIRNMIQMNLSGIPCLLYNTAYNQSWGPIGRIYSLDKDEVFDTYHLFLETIFPNFRSLI